MRQVVQNTRLQAAQQREPGHPHQWHICPKWSATYSSNRWPVRIGMICRSSVRGVKVSQVARQAIFTSKCSIVRAAPSAPSRRPIYDHNLKKMKHCVVGTAPLSEPVDHTPREKKRRHTSHITRTSDMALPVMALTSLCRLATCSNTSTLS